MNPKDHSVDLNADLGEGFANDRAILELVTSASLSCGGHAGDRATILETLREAARCSVIVGAHPGYADRAHFGRRELSATASEVERLILDQFETLATLAAEAGVVLRYLKPHGALYHQAQREPETAAGVLAAVAQLKVPLLGQPSSLLEAQARQQGLDFITEGFPDRRYRDDGSLVPRTEANAILVEPGEVEAQVVQLVRAGIRSLCIHGDDPRAVENALSIRILLERNGIRLKGFV